MCIRPCVCDTPSLHKAFELLTHLPRAPPGGAGCSWVQGALLLACPTQTYSQLALRVHVAI